MAYPPSRALKKAALFSLAVWLITWLLAYALLSFSSSTFAYLYLGLLEPLVFIVAMIVPREPSLLAAVAFLLIAFAALLQFVQFALRFTTVRRPFDADQVLPLLFVIMSFIALFVYIWYTVTAFRVWSLGDRAVAASPPSSGQPETPGGPGDTTETQRKSLYTFTDPTKRRTGGSASLDD